jgi:hypothetical protein
MGERINMSATNEKMVREYLRELYSSLQDLDYDELASVSKVVSEHTLSMSIQSNNRAIDDVKRFKDRLDEIFPNDPKIVEACIIQFIKQSANFSIVATTHNAIGQLVLQRISQKYAQYVPE